MNTKETYFLAAPELSLSIEQCYKLYEVFNINTTIDEIISSGYAIIKLSQEY